MFYAKVIFTGSLITHKKLYKKAAKQFYEFFCIFIAVIRVI